MPAVHASERDNSRLIIRCKLQAHSKNFKITNILMKIKIIHLLISFPRIKINLKTMVNPIPIPIMLTLTAITITLPAITTIYFIRALTPIKIISLIGFDVLLCQCNYILFPKIIKNKKGFYFHGPKCI